MFSFKKKDTSIDKTFKNQKVKLIVKFLSFFKNSRNAKICVIAVISIMLYTGCPNALPAGD